jgi:hypothetical protein
MKTFKVWLAIGLIFIAGFAAGSVATRTVTRRTIARILSNPNQLHLLVERRLARRLQLDAEQRQKVDTILAGTQNEVKSLRLQFAPHFQGIMSNAQTQISAILTPRQQAQFDRLREENQALLGPR